MSKQKQLKYQTVAIEEGIDHLNQYNEFKLQAPTGSGKTFIIAKLIDQYLEDSYLNNKPTTFIFIAPSTGKLDHQGYEKISKYLKNDWVKGYNTEYIGTSNEKTNKSYLKNIDYFKENTVYFFGWQLFKKNTKITEINSERNNIYRVINNTKLKGINIVLIIDEAHREVQSKKEDENEKQKIIKELNPFKIIKVSATLKQKDIEPDWIITYDDVINEAAIKKMVDISSVDTSLKNYDQMDETTQLILSAINKQKEVKEAYFKNKIDINPLIVIQIPDNVNVDGISTEKELLIKIDELLKKYKYKKAKNYALWLDKLKTNDKQEILDNESPIDILIFKQAIATGWDIPRANILVRIRDSSNKSFNIQTLGRILRNPFFKYYNNDLIDNAFVFTKDEKYKEYIKQEDIVIESNDIKYVERSKKSQWSNLQINKILIKTNYEEKELINHIVNTIINNKEFLKFFDYDNSNNEWTNAKIQSKDIIEPDANKFYRAIEKSKQSSLVQQQNNINLFDLYIKFKTITKSNTLIINVLDQLTKSLKNINKKIKDFYLACCYNWKWPIFNINNKFYTLKEWIENIKNDFLKNNKIQIEQEVFMFPEQYKVTSHKYKIDEWDGVNSFKVSVLIKKLDSEQEKEFYKKMKDSFRDDDENNFIHIFRNGTNPKYDYYIEYMNDEAKVCKFFPDFIVVNENTKTCYIFEAKDRIKSIDQNAEEKFNKFIENINNNLIKKSYECDQIIQVSLINDEDLNFIVNNNESGKKFSDIKKMILSKE